MDALGVVILLLLVTFGIFFAGYCCGRDDGEEAGYKKGELAEAKRGAKVVRENEAARWVGAADDDEIVKYGDSYYRVFEVAGDGDEPCY